jgi:hypothetical protein
MALEQINRLKNDLAELDRFASSLRREGAVDLSKKILTKRKYLMEYLTNLEVA